MGQLTPSDFEYDFESDKLGSIASHLMKRSSASFRISRSVETRDSKIVISSLAELLEDAN